MSRLTDLKNEICGELAAITQAAGYSLDFGSVNAVDLENKRYPTASITMLNEQPESAAIAAFGYDRCQVQIVIMCERAQPEAAKLLPLYELDGDYDAILDSVKRKLRFRLGVLPLSGVVTPFLSYGRTAMLANFVVVGMVAAISARGQEERRPAARPPLRRTLKVCR